MHLIVAAVQHISHSIQLQQPGGNSQPMSPSLLRLEAAAVQAMSGLMAHVNFVVGVPSAQLHEKHKYLDYALALLDMEHYQAWNALTVIVTVYTEVLQHQQCLPEVPGLGSAHNSTDNGSSSSSSSSSSRGQAAQQGGRRSARRQQRQQPAGTQQHALGTTQDQDPLADLALQAWQEAQGQWSSLPASHTWLLEQLGGSVPVAVWLAATSLRIGQLGYLSLNTTRCVHQLLDATAARGPYGAPPQPYLPAAMVPKRQEQQDAPQLSFEDTDGPRKSTAQLTQQLAEQSKLDSMLSAVLLYGVAHMVDNNKASARGRPDNILAAHHLAASAQRFAAQVQEMTLLLQHEVKWLSQWTASAARELLLLCLTALERYRYPQAAVSSEAAGVQATGASAVGQHAAATGAGRSDLAVQAALVHLLCMLVSEPFNGLSNSLSTAEAIHLPVTMRWPAAHAGSMLPAADPGVVEPCSHDPAVPPDTGSSQGVPSTLVHRAVAVCRGLEAFVRYNTLSLCKESRLSDSMSSDLMLQCSSEQKALMYEIARVCSVQDPEKQPAASLSALAATSGRGSKLQVQFFSLWSSLLKLESRLLCLPEADSITPQGSPFNPFALYAGTSLFLLKRSASEATSAPDLCPADPHSSSSSSVNSSATGTTSTFAHPDLMWMMLLGRCCLHWAGVTAAMLAAACNEGLIAELQTAGSVSSNVLAVLLNAVPKLASMPLRAVAEKVQVLLSRNSSMAQQLSDCGYDITSVTDSAAAAHAALDAFEQLPDSGTNVAEGFSELALAMKALGEALTSLAAPYCCNYPACLNISGPSDVALVSGKSCICGKCKVARYCGKACQQQHWRLHKPVCKALAAAQQAAQLVAVLGSTSTQCCQAD